MTFGMSGRLREIRVEGVKDQLIDPASDALFGRVV